MWRYAVAPQPDHYPNADWSLSNHRVAATVPGAALVDQRDRARQPPGTVGARVAISLDEAVQRTQRIHDAGKKANPDVIVLCHGGPIAEPDDVRYVLGRTKGIDGFFGASSIERLPVERAITQTVRDFKSIPLR
jgi:predicted TIM-barrel enzyme